MDDYTDYLQNDPMQAIFAGMDETRRRRFELIQRVDDKYICTQRDRVLLKELFALVDRTQAAITSAHPEGRLLAVIGESGAGKTWTIEQAIKEVPGLMDTLLCVITPRPCTLKQLGRSILSAVGYELKRDLPEHIIWEKVREQLERLKIRFVWLDELQHSFEGKNDSELLKISDTIKNLMQRRSWPVSFVMSGLPIVSTFLGRDRQIERRSSTIAFGPVTYPANVGLVRHLVRSIIVDHAGMRQGPGIARPTVVGDPSAERMIDLATDEFCNRLCHATGSQFGVIVTMTRKAVFNAFDRPDFGGAVHIHDFAAAYAEEKSAVLGQNVFLADNWHEIDPRNSRDREPSTTNIVEAVKQARKTKGRQ